MGLTDLTVAEIRRVCTERSYERGVGYYHSGRITSVRLAGSTVRATVEGTDEYNVELAWKGRRGGGRGEYYCDCPYSYEGECKHVVSVLLHVKDHSAAMIREAKSASASIKSLLGGASEGYLREFLAAEMAGDAGLAERFARGTGTPYVAGLDYHDRIASMFRAEAAAEGRDGWDDDFGRVDLGGAMKAAAGFEKSGDMAEASRIYGQIASAVSAHIDEVIGAEDHRGDARAAIAKWASCMDKNRPAEADRRACISDAFFGYRRDAKFSGDYESAMWSLCRSDADYVHLLDLTAPHMPDPVPVDGGGAAAGRRWGGAKPRRRRRDLIERESPERRRMLRIQVRALEKLGRRSDIDRLYEEHGRADPAVCAMRVRRLAAAGAKAKAARVAAEGLDLFGRDESIAAAAAAVYDEREPGRLEVLSELFMRTFDWSYHDKLREMPGWPGERAAVLKMLARDRKRPDRLIEMLVREGMHRRALQEIVRCRDMALFERYLEPVSSRYPRAYLAAYGRCIAGTVDRAGSGWQYSRLVMHLERMAKIAGGKEVAAGLAAVISAKYPRKRALLKALAPYAGRLQPKPRPGTKPRARPRAHRRQA